jgi:DNA polymerase III subunit beta
MNCILDKFDLVRVLNNIRSCIKSKTNIIDITSSIYFNVSQNVVNIKATNYNMFIKDSIIPIKVNETGNFIVPFNVLYQLVKNYPTKQVQMILIDDKLHLSNNKNLYKIPVINDIFPEEYKVENDITLTIKEGLIKEIFDRFIKIIPDESHNPVFTGLNIKIKKDNSLDFVATDTYRMYLTNCNPVNIKGLNNISYIIPKIMIRYLIALLDNNEDLIQLDLNDNYIKLTKKNLVIKHQLIAGSYPNYEKIIPNNLPNKINLHANILKDAINRIKILSEFSIGDNLIKIQTDENNILNLLTSDMENKENTKIKLMQPIIKNIDYRQILDFINTSDNEKIYILYDYNSNTSPLLLNDGNIKYMMLPVQ